MRRRRMCALPSQSSSNRTVTVFPGKIHSKQASREKPCGFSRRDAFFSSITPERYVLPPHRFLQHPRVLLHPGPTFSAAPDASRAAALPIIAPPQAFLPPMCYTPAPTTVDYAPRNCSRPGAGRMSKRQPAITVPDPPSHNFFSFSPGLFAKRPTSPRRSALYSTAYARGTRHGALILRKTRKPAQGA